MADRIDRAALDARRELVTFERNSLSAVEMMRVRATSRAWPWHHEGFALCLIGRGVGEWSARGRRMPLAPGVVCLLAPGDFSVNTRVDAPLDFHVAFVSPRQVQHWFCTRWERLRFAPPGDADARAVGRSLMAASRAFAHGDPFAISQAMIEAIERSRTSDGRKTPGDASARSPVVVRARELLHAGAFQKTRLEDVADACGVSTSYLVRAFGAAIGVSPYRYLLALRMARARARLRDGENIADVARDLGFSDTPHFYRHFRQYIGVPPGVFGGLPRE